MSVQPAEPALTPYEMGLRAAAELPPLTPEKTREAARILAAARQEPGGGDQAKADDAA